MEKNFFDLNKVCEEVFSLLEFEMESKRLKKIIDIDKRLQKV